MAPSEAGDNMPSANGQVLENSSGDDVYVTGISGYFPQSDSVKELSENLFNKVDLITDDERRWRHVNPEIPVYSGKMNKLEKFDASFFGIGSKEAHAMDPSNRIIMEKVFECLIDAGVNPGELRNTNTGVFIGGFFSETEEKFVYQEMQNNNHGIVGTVRAMLANGVSDYLGLKGPSQVVDTACSSSLFALEHAYKAIRDGQCDSAIVGGCNVCIQPLCTLVFARLGVLSTTDGRCKTFDNRADGYVRSESVVACYLQKAKDSRRVYAKLVHAKTNCDGYKQEGITYPAGQMQTTLLELFYDECGIPPSTVEFVEAHGTGTIVGDPEEVGAIDEVFCKNRKKPLYIGSIKSNLGHCEASSGLNSLVKACIAYNTGYLPPNLHYQSPRMIPGLTEGRLKVVTEKTPWNRGLFALSSFGFGGSNAHILLKQVPKKKINTGLPLDDLPRLVCLSGRTEAAVARVFDDLESRPLDVDEIRLWHAVHERNIPGFDFRGYVLLEASPTSSIRLSRDVRKLCNMERRQQRPIAFMYTDIRTCWANIATSLMTLPSFANSIQRCSSALEQKQFNLVQLFNEDVLRQNKFSVLGAAAVYIGLTDLLKSIGIKPDYIISTCYDIGEICSAYADDSLTLEQTILAAYEINMLFNNKLKNSSIIKVALDYQTIVSICPAETYIEYDTDNKCIISGPATIVGRVESLLKAQGVKIGYPDLITKIVFGNKDDADGITNFLENLFLKPISRSKRRISLLKSQELTTGLPAVNIQIGLKQEMQVIANIKMSQANFTSLSLVQENENILHYLFSAIGMLYQTGLNLKLAKMYPQVSFPVPQDTPMISHLVQWDHCDDWYVGRFTGEKKIAFGKQRVQVDVREERNNYLLGHNIDGRVIYPATGYLALVWEALACMLGRLSCELPVEFENVYFQRATNIPKDGILTFDVMIHRDSGKFEIVENEVSIVSGRIYETKGENKIQNETLDITDIRPTETMNTKDFYKELNIRGYQYKGLFRGVRGCSVDGSSGHLVWNNNWITFLDTILQSKIVSTDTRSLYVPTRIEKISIDPFAQKQITSKVSLDGNDERLLQFKSYPNIDMISTGGVKVRGIHCTAISKKPSKGIAVYERNEFVANYSTEQRSLEDIIRIDLQLIHENIQTYKFKSVELVDEEYKLNGLRPIIESVADVLGDLPLVQAELSVISKDTIILPSNIIVANKNISSESNNTLFIGANLLGRQKVLEEAASTLKDDCFLLSRENYIPEFECAKGYEILTSHHTGSEYLVLLRKIVKAKPTKYVKIESEDLSFSWLNKVNSELIEGQKLVLYSQDEPINGLLGFVNCLRKEPGGEMVTGLLIADPTAPPFNPECNFYEQQISKGLALNVFKDGQWGTYRHLLLKDMEKVPAAHAYVNTATIGDLSSLRWWEGQFSESQSFSKPNKSLVHVYCSAMNFRDVMTAMGRVTLDAVARGRLAQDCVQGIEISGRISNGTRVMAICDKGLSNLVECDQSLLWPIPEEWSFEEAATVPVAYGTVIMALVMIGRVKRGESILIHAGSGGVGQAAINIALHHGLEIFTTVGTPAKRAFIKRLFPQLKDSHIGNSRDTSFEHMIRRETNGRGVDVVLNSLADEKLQASVKCLRRGGRFLEIGKYDITINTQLQMCFLKNEISFHGVMLDFISDDVSLQLRIKLRDLLMEGIVSGAVRPLTYCTFETNEIEAAYRYMSAGKHIGKVIVKIREKETNEKKVKPTFKIIDAVPRYMCNENQVYVLVGGLGGFGLELADWLVIRGARKLVICSRRGISNGYQRLRLRIWKSYGVQIHIAVDDVSTEKGCEDMLKAAAALGPVKAIFNLAVILNDAIFTNQTPEMFMNSFRPKAMATIYLDKSSRTLCPELRDFVIFSSVSCGRGNAGQTNYGFSNSIMERICEERKKAGLPALAIQWGAIGDVGLVADMQEENIQLEIGGTLQQGISSCLQSLDKFLKQSSPIVSSIVVAEKRTLSGDTNSVVDVIAQILGISDLKSISRQIPLAEIGMDSVMAVEIKQALERDFELFITAQEVRTLTFAKLTELVKTDSVAQDSALSSTTTTTKTDMGMGLEVMMKNFGDEKLAMQPYIFLDCLTSDTEKSINGTDNIMFMMPGLESSASTFKPLCSQLNARTCVLQLGLNHEQDLDTMVTTQYQTMKQFLGTAKSFTLIGYSFGSVIMLRLAAKLESEGYKGIVFCIDGSPVYLNTIVKELLHGTDDMQLQNNIILHCFNMTSGNYTASQDLLEKLPHIESFEERVQCAVNMSPMKSIYSDEFMISMAKVGYRRIKILESLIPDETCKIDSPIVLMRCKKPATISDCGEKYGLERITRGSVTVHHMDENHSTIVESEECASIINRTLAELNIQNTKELTRSTGTK